MHEEEASYATVAQGPSLKFLLVSTTSVISFVVSLVAAAATFAPAVAQQASDVSLLAMLTATTLGAWAASLAQQSAP